MSRQMSGPTAELFRSLLDRYRLSVDDYRPLVTLPDSGVVDAFLNAAEESTLPESLAIIVPQRTLDDLPQCYHPDVASLDTHRGCVVRSASTTTTVVSVPGETTIVDTTLPESLALTSCGNAHERYLELWETGADPEFETPPRQQLLTRVEHDLGERSRAVVEAELNRGRARSDQGVDIVSLAVWSAAISSKTVVRDVIELVEDLDIRSRGTVERRVDRLQEADLVEVAPLADGSRGRPDRDVRVAVDVDDPANPPDWVRSALLA